MSSGILEFTRQAEALLKSHGLDTEAATVRATFPVTSSIQEKDVFMDELQSRIALGNALAAYQLHELWHQSSKTGEPMPYLPWVARMRDRTATTESAAVLMRPSGLGDRSHMRSALSTMLEKLSVDTERAQLTGTFEETFVEKSECRPPR